MGIEILGASKGVDGKEIVQIFADNPLGQTKQLTPFALVRKLKTNMTEDRKQLVSILGKEIS